MEFEGVLPSRRQFLIFNFFCQLKLHLIIYNSMEKFTVTILGCGSALPTTRHNGSAQIVNIREKLFLIDCAEGTQVHLRRNHISLNRLQTVFISHLHGDHCFGLPGLISTQGLLGRTAPLHIYGPEDI
jgi:ribonuclease Z